MATNNPDVSEGSPVFSKVVVASLAAAVTPFVTRFLADRLGLLIDEEEGRRVLVTLVTLATTFMAGYFKSEPTKNVRAYLRAKTGRTA